MEKSIPIHASLRASCEWPPEGFNKRSSSRGLSRSHQHVIQISDKTVLASVHLASTVLDRFDRDNTPVDKKVVYAEPKADISGIDCIKQELAEAQRTDVRELLERIA